MTPQPRKPSRLASKPYGAPDPPPPPATTPDPAPPSPGPRAVPTPAAAVPPPPVTRSPRRRTDKLPDDATVSFNCNMTVGLRRVLRIYAGTYNVTLQDIVEDALADYFEARGIDAPRRPLDQR